MKIAFNTANLVGKATGYQFKLSNWMDHHHKTVAQTDEKEFAAICAEIASHGYTAIELWAAHADASVMTPRKARVWLTIMHDHGIAPIGYAGGMNRGVAEVCSWLGIPAANGMFSRESLPEVHLLCEEYGLKANYENHPEKSVEEILARIDGGSEHVGVAIDSGWLGTQNLDAVTAIKGLGSLVRHIHIKDVTAPGGHDTCLLGKGMVDLQGMLVELKAAGYQGWYAWEDEPEDRNPFDSAAQNLQWIKHQLSQI